MPSHEKSARPGRVSFMRGAHQSKVGTETILQEKRLKGSACNAIKKVKLEESLIQGGASALVTPSKGTVTGTGNKKQS